MMFNCHPGYRASGPTTVTCQEDLTWSSPLPCEGESLVGEGNCAVGRVDLAAEVSRSDAADQGRKRKEGGKEERKEGRRGGGKEGRRKRRG